MNIRSNILYPILYPSHVIRKLPAKIDEVIKHGVKVVSIEN